MLKYINEQLLTVLRQMKDPRGTRSSKHWIMYSDPEIDAIYPFIAIKQMTSKISNAGIGRVTETMATTVIDTFTGTGAKQSFQLTNTDIKHISSVVVSTADINEIYTYNNYWTYSLNGLVTFRDSVIPANGSTVTITYTTSPDSAERMGYRYSPSYSIIIYARKNTQGSEDEIFNIDGEKMANGKLVDYLTELVCDRMILDYEYFRSKGLIVKITGISDEVYDSETRLFAKQVTIEVETDLLDDDVQRPIWEVETEYTVTLDL